VHRLRAGARPAVHDAREARLQGRQARRAGRRAGVRAPGAGHPLLPGRAAGRAAARAGALAPAPAAGGTADTPRAGSGRAMAGKMITAKELAAGLSDVLAQAPHQAPARFRHAVVDSRKAGRGDLFFALAGEHADGHDFVRDAAARGASGAVVARAVDAAIAQWVVRDPLAALQALARQRRASLTALRVVGVTGSVGKASTKEVIAAVLATKHRVLKSEGNLNSEIGMPLVLLELNARHRRAVLEMGMWARGEIALLCHLARPQVGVVTMVGPVHMERLGTIDAIAEEKGVLPASLPADGVAVLNADDARVLAMRERT